MRILVVAATGFEVRPTFSRMAQQKGRGKEGNLTRYQSRDHEIDLLIPGVGMMKTAYFLGKYLPGPHYDLAINVGIAGTYDLSVLIGSVVHVTSDCISELGAEDETRFVSIFDLGLQDPDEFPYTGGKLVNRNFPRLPVLGTLPEVTGNTVNTIHSDPEKIKELLNRFPADVESMEGAAFFYTCMMEKVPCIQIRAVSNYVEKPDKSQWDIPLSLKNLNSILVKLLDHIKKTNTDF